MSFPRLALTFTQAEAISLLLIVAGFVGVVVTLRTRRWWAKIASAAGVPSALSACVPLRTEETQRAVPLQHWARSGVFSAGVVYTPGAPAQSTRSRRSRDDSLAA